MKKTGIVVALLLVILAGVIFYSKYYHKGTISGDIYLSVSSTDTQRIGGADVILYKSENPDRVVQQIQEIQNQDIKPLREALEEYSKAVDEMGKNFEAYKKSNDPKYLSQEISRKAKEKFATVEKLKAEWNSKIRAILTPLLFKKVKSDAKGHYEFTDVPYGRYIVFSNCRISDKDLDWLSLVEVDSRVNRLDLTNSNVTKIYFYSRESKQPLGFDK